MSESRGDAAGAGGVSGERAVRPAGEAVGDAASKSRVADRSAVTAADLERWQALAETLGQPFSLAYRTQVHDGPRGLETYDEAVIENRHGSAIAVIDVGNGDEEATLALLNAAPQLVARVRDLESELSIEHQRATTAQAKTEHQRLELGKLNRKCAAKAGALREAVIDGGERVQALQAERDAARAECDLLKERLRAIGEYEDLRTGDGEWTPYVTLVIELTEAQKQRDAARERVRLLEGLLREAIPLMNPNAYVSDRGDFQARAREALAP